MADKDKDKQVVINTTESSKPLEKQNWYINTAIYEVQVEFLKPTKSNFILRWPKEQERQGSEEIAKWESGPRVDQKSSWKDLRTIILQAMKPELSEELLLEFYEKKSGPFSSGVTVIGSTTIKIEELCNQHAPSSKEKVAQSVQKDLFDKKQQIQGIVKLFYICSGWKFIFDCLKGDKKDIALVELGDMAKNARKGEKGVTPNANKILTYINTEMIEELANQLELNLPEKARRISKQANSPRKKK